MAATQVEEARLHSGRHSNPGNLWSEADEFLLVEDTAKQTTPPTQSLPPGGHQRDFLLVEDTKQTTPPTQSWPPGRHAAGEDLKQPSAIVGIGSQRESMRYLVIGLAIFLLGCVVSLAPHSLAAEGSGDHEDSSGSSDSEPHRHLEPHQHHESRKSMCFAAGHFPITDDSKCSEVAELFGPKVDVRRLQEAHLQPKVGCFLSRSGQEKQDGQERKLRHHDRQLKEVQSLSVEICSSCNQFGTVASEDPEGSEEDPESKGCQEPEYFAVSSTHDSAHGKDAEELHAHGEHEGHGKHKSPEEQEEPEAHGKHEGHGKHKPQKEQDEPEAHGKHEGHGKHKPQKEQDEPEAHGKHEGHGKHKPQKEQDEHEVHGEHKGHEKHKAHDAHGKHHDHGAEGSGAEHDAKPQHEAHKAHDEDESHHEHHEQKHHDEHKPHKSGGHGKEHDGHSQHGDHHEDEAHTGSAHTSVTSAPSPSSTLVPGCGNPPCSVGSLRTEVATLETEDGKEAALVHFVYPRLAKPTQVLLGHGLTYELALGELEAATSKSGCTCRPWKLQDVPACATQENGYCCNPRNDPAGDWCITSAPCNGAAWDRCDPHPLRREFVVRDASGMALGAAWLTSPFTGSNPYETAPGGGGPAMKLVPGWKDPSSTVAPLTKSGCYCVEPTEVFHSSADCTAERGWCCEKGDARQRPWCWTKDACDGRSWDYCVPADTNRAVFEIISAV